MKEMSRLIVGGLTLVGLAVAGYRTYELKKIRKSIQEEQIIDIEPGVIEETRK